MEAMTFISALISLITLIVFFVMASNIGSIKNILQQEENKNYTSVYNAGELKEYVGKDQEALDLYMESYFLVSKLIKNNPKDPVVQKNKDLIVAKIKLLGGQVKEILS